MHDVGLSGGVLVGLALGCTWTGRAFATVCRMRLLRRRTPESLIGHAFLGTALWILLFGSCSYLGMKALTAALVVLATSAGLLGVAAAVQRSIPRRRSAGRWGVLLAVALPCVYGALVPLLPVVVGECFVFQGDSLIYNSVAEWLQGHAFTAPCPMDAHHPLCIWVRGMQETGHRVGPVFLLALARAVSPSTHALELFPAVTAWGVVLGIGGVYLLCRWSLRCRPGCAVAAALFAAGANPLTYSATNGFFCQIYGTAALTFALAILARLRTRSRWDFGGAVLAAASLALLLSVYSEMFPVLALVAAGFFLALAWRAGRTCQLERFLGFTAITLLAFVLFGNVECLRAVNALTHRLHQLDPDGWHLDWSGGQYWSFLMGVQLYHYEPLDPMPAVTVVATVLFLIGLARGLALRAARPALGTLLVLVGLAACFRWAAHDPWTGAIGQTWHQFKLCKWAFPLVVAFQGAGLHAILRGSAARLVAVPAVCLVLLGVSGRLHWIETEGYVDRAHDLLHSDRPLAAIRQLRHRLEELGAGSVVFLHSCDNAWLDGLYPCFLSRWPFLNGWTDPRDMYHAVPSVPIDLQVRPTPGTQVLLRGDPPFEPPQERLPLGLSLVDLQRPIILWIGNPNGLEHTSDGQAFSWIGSAEVTVELWSPGSAEGTLSFATRPGPSLPESATRRLLVTQENGQTLELVVKENRSPSFPIVLHPGLNCLRLRCLDVPSRTGPLPNGDARVLLLNVTALRFIPSATGE